MLSFPGTKPRMNVGSSSICKRPKITEDGNGDRVANGGQLAAMHEEATAALEVTKVEPEELYGTAHNLAIQADPLKCHVAAAKAEEQVVEVGDCRADCAGRCDGGCCIFFAVLCKFVQQRTALHVHFSYYVVPEVASLQSWSLSRRQ